MGSAKVQLLAQMMPTLFAEGHRVLLFSQVGVWGCGEEGLGATASGADDAHSLREGASRDAHEGGWGKK